MDRKRKLPGTILICLMLSSCTAIGLKTDVTIVLSETLMNTRAEMPDEYQISDVSFLIFDSRGCLEYSIYDRRGSDALQATLLKGENYSIYAFVNFGYEIDVDSEDELKDLEFHLAYPDEYKEGIPMCAFTQVTIGDNSCITLDCVRLMSKISIQIDRSHLSEGVFMDVTSVRIGNCPKKVKVFENSRAEDEDDCFVNGFSHIGEECRALNTENDKRISDELSIYMLENVQGRFSDKNILSDEEKVFEEYDKRNRTCSYLEIGTDYRSTEWSSSDVPLIYRFYLGGNLQDLDIERNCHYHITICPEDDGLNGNGWRVDKTGLEYIGETGLEKYPSGYINGNIGDKIHLGCILTPSNAPFDIGIDYLEADKAEGIYDYEIDNDGHGVTLTLTGPGSGLIYMEAGDPINEAALFIVEVNLPG